jgi:ankyrin repeat protein
MVKLDEDVKKIFAALRSLAVKNMAGKPISPDRKKEQRAEVYRLLELVDVDSTNSNGETLLIRAIHDTDVDLVRDLLQKGASIDGLKKQDTPLMVASEKGHVEIMTILIDAGADIKAQRKHSWSGTYNALNLAVRSRNTDAVRLLLTRGLKSCDNSALSSPLHTAASVKNVPMMSLLLEHGIGDISKVDSQGLTALQRVITGIGNDAAASLAVLLDHGAAIDQLSDNGQSALHFAVLYRDMPAVLLLLDRGADATFVDKGGQTPLHNARSVEVVTALLAKGALVNAVDDKGRTPLHCYAAHGDNGSMATSLAALLDHGAAIDQQSRDGKSALHYATTNMNTPVVSFLLGRGASTTLTDIYGQTALHRAYSVEMVTALLAKGAPVNAVDAEGMTPLHRLAVFGIEAAVSAARALLQAGADVNASDKKGEGPLHLWAEGYHSDMEFAQLLIDHGAEVAAHNNANQRPSDVARIGSTKHTFLLAAEEAQRNNHRYKRPRLEDLQPPAAIAAGAEAAAAAAEEEEDESEDDSDEDEDD